MNFYYYKCKGTTGIIKQLSEPDLSGVFTGCFVKLKTFGKIISVSDKEIASFSVNDDYKSKKYIVCKIENPNEILKELLCE